MLEDRVRQIALTVVLGIAAVLGAYFLAGVAVAALVALAAYALGVFVLGLPNAGAVAAGVVVAVAAVAVVDANTGEEPPPPERAQLREARADVRRLVTAQAEARESQEELRDVGARVQLKLASAERRAARLEDEVRKLRRGKSRRRGRARR